MARKALKHILGTDAKAENRLFIPEMLFGSGDETFPFRRFLRTQILVVVLFGITEKQ